MKKIKIFVIMVVFLLPFSAQAATYYVDGKSGLDTNPGTIGSPWKTIHKANITLEAGDTVYIRGGSESYQVYSVTDYSDGICPSNSGTSNSARITYSVYPGELVELQGDGVSSGGIVLIYKNYITVTGGYKYGLKITNMRYGFAIGPADGVPTDYSRSNEISYAWIGFCSNGCSCKYPYCMARKNAQYNYIHHCKFEEIGTLSGNAGGAGLHIGQQKPSVYGGGENYYNVVEDCEIASTGHDGFQLGGKYNVIRNNYMHNEAWYSYEGRDVSYRINESISEADRGYALVENNRVGHNDLDYRDGSNSAWKFGINYTIFRYNAIFDVTNYAMFCVPQVATSNNNYYYNNTFFSTYQKAFRFPWDDGSAQTFWEDMYGNKIKNNLHWDTSGTRTDTVDYYYGEAKGTTWANFTGTGSGDYGANIIENNYNDMVGESSATDPKFIDETITSYSSWTLPNLNLQNDSPCIDTGTYLTQAKGSGSSSTTLVVDDARYFQDGKFGDASGCDPTKWPSGVDIQADYIAIGSVSNLVQIDSINYSTNTITLMSPMTWNDNANIWLYKKSDGVQVLYGNSSDMGAYESTSAKAGAPTNPRIE